MSIKSIVNKKPNKHLLWSGNVFNSFQYGGARLICSAWVCVFWSTVFALSMFLGLRFKLSINQSTPTRSLAYSVSMKTSNVRIRWRASCQSFKFSGTRQSRPAKVP